MAEKKNPKIRFKGFNGDWEQRKLGEVVQITMGQSPDGSTYSDEPSDYILVQGNADLQNRWVKPRVWTTQVTKKAEIGDLIMSVRAPAGAMGKTAYNVVIGRGVAAIKGNEFIYQLLVKMDSDGFWKTLSRGSTFESLNSDNIKNAEVTIPKQLEQEQIGVFFCNLDNLITLHQRKYEKLQNFKKAMLEKMFPKDGADVPEIRFKGFTDAWEKRKLSDVLVNRRILQRQSGDAPRLAFASGQGVIDLSERKTNNRDQLIANEFTKNYLLTQYNDIVYNPANLKYGAIDRNKLGKGVISPIYVTFTTEETPSFIERIVTTEKFKLKALRFEEGTVIKRQLVSPEKLLSFEEMIAPSKKEQKTIGDFFDYLDRLITLQQRELEKLQNIKKALLDKMFV